MSQRAERPLSLPLLKLSLAGSSMTLSINRRYHASLSGHCFDINLVMQRSNRDIADVQRLTRLQHAEASSVIAETGLMSSLESA